MGGTCGRMPCRKRVKQRFRLQVNFTRLLDIIEDRHGRKSIIMTSQLPVSSWYDAIGDPAVADAILDRIVHSAHRIELSGESIRKINASKKSK